MIDERQNPSTDEVQPTRGAEPGTDGDNAEGLPGLTEELDAQTRSGQASPGLAENQTMSAEPRPYDNPDRDAPDAEPTGPGSMPGSTPGPRGPGSPDRPVLPEEPTTPIMEPGDPAPVFDPMEEPDLAPDRSLENEPLLGDGGLLDPDGGMSVHQLPPDHSTDWLPGEEHTGPLGGDVINPGGTPDIPPPGGLMLDQGRDADPNLFAPRSPDRGPEIDEALRSGDAPMAGPLEDTDVDAPRTPYISE